MRIGISKVGEQMKILAIIPACEGSSSLPNKNLRILNGKPMIYYAINNAKKSEYITDIIVTTNSSEIISIAKQMGVKVRMRSSNLCSTQVSLDKVINDVRSDMEFESYDYVITMQSISPTLKSITLDKAIAKCIETNCDTMISVANRANFYWTEEENEVLPYNPNRMNKHQLPPFFMETGAFLITKPEFINDYSRIGNKCELFELSSDEAIDVFAFGDLKQAENILSRKKVAFYVNGNNQQGLGHIYRVFQLADEFFSKPDIYYDINQTKPESFGNTKHNLIPVDGIKGLFDGVNRQQYDIFINDILSTSEEYMISLKESIPAAKIINFEDIGDGAKLADIVFNALYEEKGADNVKSGVEYFIASKLFLLYEPIEIKEKIKNVLVSFGGADPQNYTDRVLSFISKEKYSELRFYVIVGRAKQNFAELLEYRQSNVEILFDINNMPEIMSKCDIAMTSRGRTGFELAMLGVPTISIAQNAREEKHDFMCEENGFFYLGKNPDNSVIENALDKLLEMDVIQRKEIQRKMTVKNLYNGRKHIMNLIDNL